MQVADFLQPENVIVDLIAPSKQSVLQIVSEKAGRALGIDEARIFQPLQSRERLGSTGIGEGIAIPHTRIAGIVRPFGLLARLSKSVEFDSIDDVRVDLVFVLLLPADGATDHLNTLACTARQLRAPDILRRMRQARDATQLYAAITAQVPAMAR
ncbi:MAG TPA: PTS sugar transporter subunit IIA [Ancylobacter sp.]